jgi:hypothetical protein
MTEYVPDEYKVEQTRRWGPVPVLPGIDAEIAAALERSAQAAAPEQPAADEAA